MQAKNGSIILTVIIAAIVIIGAIYFLQPKTPEPVVVPTAAEIAAEITIPTTDLSQLDELWDGVYADDIEDLEDDAIDVCADEFEFDEVEDLFDEDDEVEFIKEYEDDRVIEVIDLGLDDEDDREVSLSGVIKVGVIADIGDDFRDKVYITCEVTSDDGDLEAELSYTL